MDPQPACALSATQRWPPRNRCAPSHRPRGTVVRSHAACASGGAAGAREHRAGDPADRCAGSPRGRTCRRGADAHAHRITDQNPGPGIRAGTAPGARIGAALRLCPDLDGRDGHRGECPRDLPRRRGAAGVGERRGASEGRGRLQVLEGLGRAPRPRLRHRGGTSGRARHRARLEAPRPHTTTSSSHAWPSRSSGGSPLPRSSLWSRISAPRIPMCPSGSRRSTPRLPTRWWPRRKTQTWSC